MATRPTPYLKYGVPILFDRLLAFPTRQTRPPFTVDGATPERIKLECEVVDEWAIELFDYCRRRPQGNWRFHAMLLDALKMDPVDAHLRIGLRPTAEACQRVRHWLRFAEQLP